MTLHPPEKIDKQAFTTSVSTGYFPVTNMARFHQSSNSTGHTLIIFCNHCWRKLIVEILEMSVTYPWTNSSLSRICGNKFPSFLRYFWVVVWPKAHGSIDDTDSRVVLVIGSFCCMYRAVLRCFEIAPQYRFFFSAHLLHQPFILSTVEKRFNISDRWIVYLDAFKFFWSYIPNFFILHEAS